MPRNSANDSLTNTNGGAYCQAKLRPTDMSTQGMSCLRSRGNSIGCLLNRYAMLRRKPFAQPFAGVPCASLPVPALLPAAMGSFNSISLLPSCRNSPSADSQSANPPITWRLLLVHSGLDAVHAGAHVRHQRPALQTRQRAQKMLAKLDGKLGSCK